jgi:hypothetical protein
MEGELQSVDEAATSLKAVHGVVGVQNEATMGGESEVVAPEASQPLAALHVQKSTSTENLNTNTVGYKDEEEMVPTVAVAQEEGLQEMTPPPALSFAERWPPAPAPQRPYGSIGPVDPPTTGLARQVASMMLASGTYEDQLREHNRLHYGGEQEAVGPLGRVRGPLITGSITS